MGSTQDLITESWCLYSFGILAVALRLYSQIWRRGIRHLEIDDYLMITAAGWYTAFVVTNIQLAEGGGGSLYHPEEFATFTPQDILNREAESKVEIVSEQCILVAVYTIKVCMLCIYWRLTMGLKQRLAVKLVGVYVAIGFAATELCFFFNCRPFSGYWTLPPPLEECATYRNYTIVQCIFNISSDVFMLFIPLPLLLGAQFPPRQKIVLVGIFGLGIFVIIAATLTKVFTFRDVFDPGYQFWYLREVSVAMYVSNFPLIWPLLRRVFPILRQLTPGEMSSSHKGRTTSGNSGHPLSRLDRARHGATRLDDNTLTNIGRTESEERINDEEDRYWDKAALSAKDLTSDGNGKDAISTNVTVTFSEEPADEQDAQHTISNWQLRGNTVKTDIRSGGSRPALR